MNRRPLAVGLFCFFFALLARCDLSAVAKQLDTGGVRVSMTDGGYHWDATRGMFDLLDSLMGFAVPEMMKNGEMPVDPRPVLKALPGMLGANEFSGLGESTIKTKNGFQSRYVYHHTPNAKGLLWTHSGKAFSVRKEMGFLPATSAIALRRSLSPEAIKDVFDHIVELLGLPAEMVVQPFDAAEEEGLPLRAILQSLEGRFSFALTADAENLWPIPLPLPEPIQVPAPGFVFMLDVKSDVLLETILELMKESGTIVPLPLKVGEVDCHTIPIPVPVPTAVAVTFGTIEGRFLVASSAELFKETAGALQAGDLRPSVLVDAWDGDVPDRAVGCAFGSSVLPTLITELTPKLTALAGDPDAEMGIQMMMNLYGGWLSILNSAAILEQNPQGLRITLHHPNSLPAGGNTTMAAPAMVGMMAAIAVPAFTKARLAAQQNVCKENLRQLDSAAQMYLIENGLNALPEDFEIGNIVGPERYIPHAPTCSKGGIYRYNRDVSECSLPEHQAN